MNTKQVIVIRKDLNMRKGKIAAQASHASMAFLTRGMDFSHGEYGWFGETPEYSTEFGAEVQDWMKNSFRKICLYVESAADLDEVYKKASAAGLEVHMVIDSGLTEFNGVPTKTCIAIGPHDENRFEGITNHLSLF